jgi:hypothetical protein
MVHGRDENVACEICQKTFKNKPSLRAHVRQSHYESYQAARMAAAGVPGAVLDTPPQDPQTT